MNNISVQEVIEVGPKLTETLAQIGIHSVEDLLYYFPNRYDHYEQKLLHELVHNEKVTITGEVIHEPTLQFYQKRKSRLVVSLRLMVWWSRVFCLTVPLLKSTLFQVKRCLLMASGISIAYK